MPDFDNYEAIKHDPAILQEGDYHRPNCPATFRKYGKDVWKQDAMIILRIRLI